MSFWPNPLVAARRDESLSATRIHPCGYYSSVFYVCMLCTYILYKEWAKKGSPADISKKSY